MNEYKYLKYKSKYINLKQIGGTDIIIQKAWSSIIETSYYLKSKYDVTFDGRLYWNILKSIFEKIDISYVETKSDNDEPIIWNASHKQIIKKFNELFSKYNLLEKDINGKLIEHNHFLLQLINIPTKNNPSFTRLMQIALNIGQLKAFMDRFPFEIKTEIYNFINDENLLNISTYMTVENYTKYNFTQEDLSNLDLILTNQTTNPPIKK